MKGELMNNIVNDRDSLELIYIRHSFGSRPVQDYKDMWDAGIIALAYDPISSLDPKDYQSKSAKDALTRLNKYCRNGAIVCADYRNLNNGKMLIGILIPGTSPYVTTCGDHSDYKVAKLMDVIEVPYIDYSVLLSVQPRRGGVLVKFGNNDLKNFILSLLNGKEAIPSLSLLSDSQLEVLCYEHLRSINEIDHLLLPIGRTLKDIDIIGINKNGEHAIAQVTYYGETNIVRKKEKAMCQYIQGRPNARAFLYSSKPSRPYTCEPGVTHYLIQDVFNSFGANSLFITKLIGSGSCHKR
jgi:hypothetical protein